MCASFIVGAQNNTSLKTSLQLLQKAPDFWFPIDNTGFSELKNPQFYTESGEANFFNIDGKNVHFVDFNNDGLKDIIYQNTEHYIGTILFENKENAFTEIASIPGKLLEIIQNEKTTIYILKGFIGCDTISLLIELVIDSDNTITDSLLFYYSDTTIEAVNTTFESKVISGILRTQPVIDNIEQADPCTGALKKGNQVRTIENKMVTIIKKQNDWSLVVCKDGDTSSIAWIKN